MVTAVEASSCGRYFADVCVMFEGTLYAAVAVTSGPAKRYSQWNKCEVTTCRGTKRLNPDPASQQENGAIVVQCRGQEIEGSSVQRIVKQMFLMSNYPSGKIRWHR